MGEPTYQVTAYLRPATLEESIDALVADLSVPMTWNYWQSFVATLGRRYGKKFVTKGELRELYNAKMSGKFGAEWVNLVPMRAYAPRPAPGAQPTGVPDAPTGAAPAKAAAAMSQPTGGGASGGVPAGKTGAPDGAGAAHQPQ